ncbi:MAG: ATP synthase F1 subunit gamma [Clostridiales Family XIII bacterium]|jgi:F-type H+-transporting ATPase subunit gamma|nr:ATP synthase F1 subunit gamma [Clostridiales Family XIII bacterium]
MSGASLQDIKRRSKSVSSIEHITSAMKLVSAAKLRRAKATYESTREYLHLVTEAIEDIFNNHAGDIPSKFVLGNREAGKTCFVVVTSNRGLAGSFNSNIIKRAEKAMQRDDHEPMLITVGSKGYDYFSRRGYKILENTNRAPETIQFHHSRLIGKPALNLFDAGELARVVLIHTAFVSPLEQRPHSAQLLPFEIELDPEIGQHERYMEYEPAPDQLFDYLVRKYVEIMIHGAIVESATCEHAARRIAMESATDNAHTMIADLNLSYNRARQAAITSEITEIVSGADALK